MVEIKISQVANTFKLINSIKYNELKLNTKTPKLLDGNHFTQQGNRKKTDRDKKQRP